MKGALVSMKSGDYIFLFRMWHSWELGTFNMRVYIVYYLYNISGWWGRARMISKHTL